MFGATVVAEGGRIEIGESCIIMENAVIRSTIRWSTTVGDHCLVGPHAHVVGCTIEDEVFIATGAAIFHGAHLGKGCEVRVNGVVHLKSYLQPGETVPIGWVAAGNPAKILSSNQHEEIWSIQKPLNFPLIAYGIDRKEADMRRITERVTELLGSHKDDSDFS
jgi:carbonic anhydrase/acetyltransferase-like protein (isoleucine patch superfamily)